MAVQALLKFNGTDGSTTFTDDTANQTWSVGGTGAVAELDTANPKFGTASLLVDEGSYITSTLGTALSGAYTIEFWVYIDSTQANASSNLILMEWGNGTTLEFQVRYSTSSHDIQVYSYNSGSHTISSGSARSTDLRMDTWLHIFVQRSADDQLYGGLFGYVTSESTNTHANVATDVTDVTIGDYNTGTEGATSFPGWIDSVRIIDEEIYLSAPWNGQEDDPGLTYTVQGLDIQIDDVGFSIPHEDQRQGRPYGSNNTSGMPGLCVTYDLLNPDEVSECSKGIQIWG